MTPRPKIHIGQALSAASDALEMAEAEIEEITDRSTKLALLYLRDAIESLKAAIEVREVRL